MNPQQIIEGDTGSKASNVRTQERKDAEKLIDSLRPYHLNYNPQKQPEMDEIRKKIQAFGDIAVEALLDRIVRAEPKDQWVGKLGISDSQDELRIMGEIAITKTIERLFYSRFSDEQTQSRLLEVITLGNFMSIFEKPFIENLKKQTDTSGMDVGIRAAGILFSSRRGEFSEVLSALLDLPGNESVRKNSYIMGRLKASIQSILPNEKSAILFDHLADQNQTSKNTALEVLIEIATKYGKLGADSNCPVAIRDGIVKLLNSPEPALQRSGVMLAGALGAAGGDDIDEALVKLFDVANRRKDSDQWNDLLITTFGEIGASAVPELKIFWSSSPILAARALAEIGQDAGPEVKAKIVGWLNDPPQPHFAFQTELQIESINLLAKMSRLDGSNFSEIAPYLLNEDPMLRQAAANAYANFPPTLKKDVAPLVEAYVDRRIKFNQQLLDEHGSIPHDRRYELEEPTCSRMSLAIRATGKPALEAAMDALSRLEVSDSFPIESIDRIAAIGDVLGALEPSVEIRKELLEFAQASFEKGDPRIDAVYWALKRMASERQNYKIASEIMPLNNALPMHIGPFGVEFSDLDQNKDRELNFDELNTLSVPTLAVKSLFSRFDIDSSGSLSFEEFKPLYVNINISSKNLSIVANKIEKSLPIVELMFVVDDSFEAARYAPQVTDTVKLVLEDLKAVYPNSQVRVGVSYFSDKRFSETKWFELGELTAVDDSGIIQKMEMHDYEGGGDLRSDMLEGILSTLDGLRAKNPEQGGFSENSQKWIVMVDGVPSKFSNSKEQPVIDEGIEKVVSELVLKQSLLPVGIQVVQVISSDDKSAPIVEEQKHQVDTILKNHFLHMEAHIEDPSLLTGRPLLDLTKTDQDKQIRAVAAEISKNLGNRTTGLRELSKELRQIQQGNLRSPISDRTLSILKSNSETP